MGEILHRLHPSRLHADTVWGSPQCAYIVLNPPARAPAPRPTLQLKCEHRLAQRGMASEAVQTHSTVNGGWCAMCLTWLQCAETDAGALCAGRPPRRPRGPSRRRAPSTRAVSLRPRTVTRLTAMCATRHPRHTQCVVGDAHAPPHGRRRQVVTGWRTGGARSPGRAPPGAQWSGAVAAWARLWGEIRGESPLKYPSARVPVGVVPSHLINGIRLVCGSSWHGAA